MPKNILIVEDDTFFSRAVSKRLEENGYTSKCAYNVDMAIKYLNAERFDAAIVDMSLPQGSGLDFMQFAKDNLGSDIPILFFTSNNSTQLEEETLLRGSDDYVHKSKGIKILLIRLKKILKDNEKPQEAISEEMVYQDLKIDARFNEITNLTTKATIRSNTKEIACLTYLLKNPDRIVSRDELSLINYGYKYDGVTRSIDLAISRVKKSLRKLGYKDDAIVSKRGQGYILIIDNFVQNNAHED